MEFIDTHTHNYDKAYDGVEDEIILRSAAAGIKAMLQADVDSRERGSMLALCRRHPGLLYPMLGLYPGSVDADWKDEIDKINKEFENGVKPVAIGEIGLDYHYGKEHAELQKEAFRVQLELASSRDLPVNIHLRDATGDFVKIIRDCRHLQLRGNLHAFSASHETFEELQKYGDWYVGIGGVISFRNASLAKEVRHIPLERILLETDSPYLSPVPHRGERNESTYIPIIAAVLAECKNVSVEEVARVTTANARKLFSI